MALSHALSPKRVAVDNCWCVLLSGVRLLAQGLRVPSRASRGTESGRSSWPGVHPQLLLPTARMVCRHCHSCALGNVPSRSLGGRGTARQGTAEGALVHHPRSTPPACPLPLGHRTLPSADCWWSCFNFGELKGHWHLPSLFLCVHLPFLSAAGCVPPCLCALCAALRVRS